MFNYETAFSRNVGWLTQDEQQALRQKRIAIAGMGGVGGFHLLTLTRLGVEKFTSPTPILSNPPTSTARPALHVPLGPTQGEALAEIARDITPEADIRVFPAGVTGENRPEFFRGPGLPLRGARAAFKYCAQNHIPAVSAVPFRHERGFAEFSARQHEFLGLFPSGGLVQTRKGRAFSGWACPRAAASPSLGRQVSCEP
jgi:hypothetical protein